MSSVATTQLIDAAATLGPADRALLNLWVHRGLDDSALAGLSHLSVGAIQARRRMMVERLSADLELAPESVGDALQELASSNRESRAPRVAAESANGGRPTQPASDSTEGDAPAQPEAKLPPGRRRGPLIAVGLVFVAMLVGGRRRTHRRR
jgi:hypothetical protein